MKDGLSSANIRGTTISGTDFVASDDMVAGDDVRADGSYQQNFAYSEGTKLVNLSAEAIISGGMWVVGSSASGASLTPVLKPASTNQGQPLGICIADVASGATASVLTQGFYKGLIAEATLNVGVGISAGAGAALNTAKASAAGTTRGVVVMGAGSEGIIGAYLW